MKQVNVGIIGTGATAGTITIVGAAVNGSLTRGVEIKGKGGAGDNIVLSDDGDISITGTGGAASSNNDGVNINFSGIPIYTKILL